MADLHYEFGIFHERIALSPVAKAALLSARDAIRQRVGNYFRDILQVRTPRFLDQGAYAVDTMVNPLDGEYGIDNGVYLRHLDIRDDSRWPAAATVHQWILNATNGRKHEKPVDKRACVRVRCPGQYHVDLTAYAVLNGQYRLAKKDAAKWPRSDPLALIECFRSHINLHGEQLRRIVHYFKAWADFQSKGDGKMASGLILVVLAASFFQKHKKDDVAFAKTLLVISKAVSSICYVLNPVDISEELTARLSHAQKTRFKDAVNAAAEDAKQAITLKDHHKASKLWRKQLGDRFPLVPEK